ncbi:MAG: DUF2029 domain-containing protein [bacterium]|nr:DUF2029 domain-containing protein [bacterium]
MTVIPLVALVTLALVTLLGTALAPDDSGQLGGDFPAFYAAGNIVTSSGYDTLYDPVVQQAAQDGLIKNDGGYLFFAYPPFVATGYAVIAPLGYRAALIVQMVLMAAAAVASVLLLRPLSPTVDRYPIAAIAAVMLFQPLLASLIGGQNTALTMLLFAAAARAEASGYPVVAGVAIGMLAYKPQFGVPLAVLAGLSGRWRVLFGTGATWVALYLAGAAVLGLGWVGPWWEQATAFRDINATVNGPLFVSWPGFIEHLTGMTGSVGQVLGLATMALGLLALTWLWRRRHVTVAQRYALAGAGLVMIAPQSLFYEAGVALVALILLLDLDARMKVFSAVVWLSGWLYMASAPVANTVVLVVAMTGTLVAATALAVRAVPISRQAVQ